MKGKTYVHGNTITLECTFNDRYGVINDPDVVKFITYDYKHVKLNEYTTPNVIKVSTGVYTFDYTPDPTLSRSFVYYEWNGTRSGKISLLRDEIKTEFTGV